MDGEPGTWARYLIDAADQRREVEPITAQAEGFGVADAYAVQESALDLRLEGGDSVAGAKLGLTSLAKQQQMGVEHPVFGWVLASSLLGTSGEVDTAALIHPRVEPEFVFLMGAALEGPDVTVDDVLDATDAVVGGIEVIDSRYEARAAVGTGGVRPREVDLDRVGCTFEVDGVPVGSADGSALIGGPAACVALLARHLAGRGRRIEAGWVVLAGAPTDAHPLRPGSVVTARYTHFAPVTVRGI
jgi:2-oxo-3-hexenedioate decarboxylase